MTAAESFQEMGSVPRDTEEGRSLLEARVRAFGRLGFKLSAGFYVLSVILIGILGLEGGWNARILVHDFAGGLLLNTGVFGAEWLLSARGRPSLRTLYVADAASVILASTFLTGSGWLTDPTVRPELVTLISIGNMNIVRAVVVPGSAARSACISAACGAVVIASTYFFYGSHPLPYARATPAGYAAISAVFVLAIVVVSTYVTHVIYGLTQKVREATQLGQYTLDEKIGEGGMGIVYRARHSMLRRPTAVKLLPPDKAGEHNIQRFEREVQLTSLLTHPNTIAIYDFGRTPEGIFYYAMEYLEGIDLEDLVNEAGPIDPARAIHILMQVAGALGEAHEVGLIHRDVKPANIILCERGATPDVAKVLDFGLVKHVDGITKDPSLSGENMITGTPMFLSPEAILTPDKVDGRSDLYALGCVGYFMIAGAYPFDGVSIVEICGHHLHTAPKAPSSRLGRPLPSDLEAVILKCLEKAPAKRYADATALFEALRVCSDATKWDPAEARTWWGGRGREIRTALHDRPPESSSSERPRTIAVDMTARASRG
jgi:serine/threonine-protein kinase